jgi:hypothetical protein
MFWIITRITLLLGNIKSRDSSVGIETGWTSGIRFPAGSRNVFLLYSAQTGLGAQSAFYSMGTGGSFPGGKAVGARS